MPQTEPIQIPIEVTQANTAALNDVNRAIANVGKTVQTVQKQSEGLGNMFKRSWTEASSAIGVASRVLGSAKRVLDDLTSSTIQYANQVRSITQVTGQSAEEVSRMIQATDDYKIEVGALNMAMRKLANEGAPLTIESLATLSDEFLKLEPGVERQRFLMEKFGRVGRDFAEIMLAGGDAIRAQAAAQADNLIMTQANLDAARNYERAQDDLNDSIAGVKYQIGNELIPRITDGITAWRTMGDTIKQTAQNAVAAGAMSSETANILSRIPDIISGGPLGALGKITGDKTAALGILTTAEAYEKLGISSRFATAEQRAFVAAFVSASNAGNSATSSYTAWAKAIEETNTVTVAATEAVWGAAYGLEDYGNTLTSVVSYAQMYDQAEKDMATAVQAHATAEAELAAVKKANPWDTKAIEAAKAKVQETTAAIQTLKSEQDKQAAAWVNNVIAQQLAQDGLTAAEMGYILSLKVNAGEMTQAAADAAQASYDEAMKVSEALDLLDGRQVDIDINLITHGSQWAGGEGSGGGGAGKGSVQFAASGGYRSNAFVTGDAPGGQLTPYSELVVAPRGAMVYSASQTRAILQSGAYPAMAGGGEFVPAKGGVSIGNLTINIPSDKLAEGADPRTFARELAPLVVEEINYRMNQ